MPTTECGSTMHPWTVSTIGMHGSASTWVFNVVRELLIDAAGEEAVLALYADLTSQLPDELTPANRMLLIKSHQGSPGLDCWLAERRAQIVLSVRDPRDAAISMAQRFKRPLQQTVRWIFNDCERLLELKEQNNLLLRYEDRFFENLATVRKLAEVLKIKPEPAKIEQIFHRYETKAIRIFAKSLMALPAERLTTVGGFQMDRVTQILEPHISDTRSGKWRSLPGPVQASMNRIFSTALKSFGYMS